MRIYSYKILFLYLASLMQFIFFIYLLRYFIPTHAVDSSAKHYLRVLLETLNGGLKMRTLLKSEV